MSAIRLAIRNERKLAIAYEDEASRSSKRTIWPFALGFFDCVRMLIAWCELRNDFRHFRADRITPLDETAIPAARPRCLKHGARWRSCIGRTDTAIF